MQFDLTSATDAGLHLLYDPAEVTLALSFNRPTHDAARA